MITDVILLLGAATEEKVAAILRRPYARELVKEEDGTWFARIVEFKGCSTVGGTEAEALANLADAIVGWVTVMVEDGESIPEPIKDAQQLDGRRDAFLKRHFGNDTSGLAQIRVTLGGRLSWQFRRWQPVKLCQAVLCDARRQKHRVALAQR